MPTDDGYPTEEELKKIETWDYRDPKGWFDYIKSCWWRADWGWGNYIVVKELHLRYDISTGGWSGNESIVSSMQKNWMLWVSTWELSRRGGHYEFRIAAKEVKPNQK